MFFLFLRRPGAHFTLLVVSFSCARRKARICCRFACWHMCVCFDVLLARVAFCCVQVLVGAATPELLQPLMSCAPPSGRTTFPVYLSSFRSCSAVLAVDRSLNLSSPCLPLQGFKTISAWSRYFVVAKANSTGMLVLCSVANYVFCFAACFVFCCVQR